MKRKFRSTCLIASALDLIGDKWSLLIVRDMLMNHKKTFKDFMSSEEKMASNLLSARLKLLENLEVIFKTKLKGNRKENIYILTDKGIELAPMIMEIVLWSDKYIRTYHTAMNVNPVEKAEKDSFLENIKTQYREFAQSLLQFNESRDLENFTKLTFI